MWCRDWRAHRSQLSRRKTGCKGQLVSFASFTLATPLFGLAAGALLLKEAITLRLAIALAALAAGVALVNRLARRIAGR